MVPCVTGNLVTFGNHTPNDGGPLASWFVNCSFSEIVAGNEEGCLCAGICEDIEEISSVARRLLETGISELMDWRLT